MGPGGPSWPSPAKGVPWPWRCREQWPLVLPGLSQPLPAAPGAGETGERHFLPFSPLPTHAPTGTRGQGRQAKAIHGGWPRSQGDAPHAQVLGCPSPLGTLCRKGPRWGLARGPSSGQGGIQPLPAPGSPAQRRVQSHRLPWWVSATVVSRARRGCSPHLQHSRAWGHQGARCELTPHLRSFQGADSSRAPSQGLLPPRQQQGCPQGGQVDPQLCGDDGDGGSEGPPHPREQGHTERWWQWEGDSAGTELYGRRCHNSTKSAAEGFADGHRSPPPSPSPCRASP